MRLPVGLRAIHDDLLPVQPLVAKRLLDETGAVTKSTAIDSTYIKAGALRLAVKGAPDAGEGRSASSAMTCLVLLWQKCIFEIHKSRLS